MFDETIRTGGEDLDLWLRLACRGVRMGHVAEPLVRYRQRPGSLSRREAASLAGNLPIFRKVLTAPGVTPRQRVLARRQIADREARIAAIEAKRYIAQGDFVSARTTLARANRHYRQPKIAVALAALRVAPRLVAWIVAWRHPARSG
jgi:hypothetical protein